MVDFIKLTNMNNTQIKRNILKARESRKISQEEMASRLGISRQAYIRIEHGSTSVICKQLPKIADECGISLDHLVLGYDPCRNNEDILRELDFNKEQLMFKESRLNILQEKLNDTERLLEMQTEHIRSLKDINSYLQRQLDRLQDE